MHFLILLGMLAALVSAEAVGQAPVPATADRLWLTLAGIAVVGSAAWVVAGVTSSALDRPWGSPQTVLKRFRHLQRMHTLLWLTVCGIIFFGLKWPAVVCGNWGMQGAFLIDEILIVTPVLLSQIVTWAAFYDVDHAVRRTLPAGEPDSSARLSRTRFVILHARHYFGLLLVPLLAVCAARDLATWAAPQAFANGTPWVLFLLTLLALGLSLPWLLRHLWDTRPLGKGGLRDRLEAAGHRLQVSSPQILIWRTKGRVVNAAVTGILPRWRYVLLSDGLLQRLTDDQVVAMYRHELGHVRYGHPQLRLLALAAPLAAWQTVIWLLPEPVANLTGRLAELSGGQWLSAVGLPLAAFSLYGLTFFSWYSRMMELQADLCACGVTLSPREQRERQSGTSEEEFRQFASTLYRLTQIHGQRSGGGGLLHPTMHDRIRFVRQAIRNPQTLAHFHKRMRRIAICLAATVMAGILVPLVTCWT